MLVARALTPVGVMAKADAGGLTVQMCTASGLQSLVLPASPAGLADPAAPPAGVAHAEADCLAALAAGAALAPPVSTLPVASSMQDEAAPRAIARAAVAAILRSQTPRGPPHSPASR